LINIIHFIVRKKVMQIQFDENANSNDDVEASVHQFLNKVPTLEISQQMPVIVFQDGVKGSYYIKCSIPAREAGDLSDLNARLNSKKAESFRANRELLLKNMTYLRMEKDAATGREFNDIIVEYNLEYDQETPLKVWGGQHRIYAIQKAGGDCNRFHGFRVYFNLTKEQRTEVALVSNTNISVSNDTFDRMIEETMFGDKLRNWCQQVGLLGESENFPDTGSRSERITVKLARSFIVNFYLGKDRGEHLDSEDLDRHVYEPYIVKTGVTEDPNYQIFMANNDILNDDALLEAGKRFVALHKDQQRAVTEKESKVKNKKAFRNKALVVSILCGWSYVAGLLHWHQERLENHYRLPRTNSAVPDPLNAKRCLSSSTTQIYPLIADLVQDQQKKICRELHNYSWQRAGRRILLWIRAL
jgi:hypothetical protein